MPPKGWQGSHTEASPALPDAGHTILVSRPLSLGDCTKNHSCLLPHGCLTLDNRRPCFQWPWMLKTSSDKSKYPWHSKNIKGWGQRTEEMCLGPGQG